MRYKKLVFCDSLGVEMFVIYILFSPFSLAIAQSSLRLFWQMYKLHGQNEIYKEVTIVMWIVN